MGERFYRQRDKLTMNNQPLPPALQRPKDYVPTYYEQLRRQKAIVQESAMTLTSETIGENDDC